MQFLPYCSATNAFGQRTLETTVQRLENSDHQEHIDSSALILNQEFISPKGSKKTTCTGIYTVYNLHTTSSNQPCPTCHEFLPHHFSWRRSGNVDHPVLVHILNTIWRSGGVGTAPNTHLPDSSGYHQASVRAVFSYSDLTVCQYAQRLPPGRQETFQNMSGRVIF